MDMNEAPTYRYLVTIKGAMCSPYGDHVAVIATDEDAARKQAEARIDTRIQYIASVEYCGPHVHA